MTRRVGVLVALLAMTATAAAKPAPPHKPAAPKAAASATDAPPATEAPDDGAADNGSAVPQLPPGWTLGPKLFDLGNNNELDLPAGLAFVDRETAKAELEKGGDPATNVSGMVISPDHWSLIIEYNDEGYIDDGDANDLDADKLFESYKNGNESQNQRRRNMGVPELFLDGWSELPRYDKATHHLLWGLKGHDKDGQIINYFTRVLGRNGYMSLNLITSAENIDKAKVAAASVIAAARFKPGFTYGDHKSSDKSSGMGLKTLILGGAGVAVYAGAKTGGLIALLLAFKKGLIVLIAGIAAFFKKIFGRGKKVQLPPDGPPPPSDGPPIG